MIVKCACGCGRVTAGGPYLKGHNLPHRDHWSKLASRKDTLFRMLLKRREYAYYLLASGTFVKDFDEHYFRLFHRIREQDVRTELEVLVDVGTSWRAVDVGIPDLKLGWEHDPGHRVSFARMGETDRDRELEQVGWRIIHAKTLPSREEIQAAFSAATVARTG